MCWFTYQAAFLEISNKIARFKVKVLPFNNNAFMAKPLRKAIMPRSRLKNNFSKKMFDENWDNYKKKRNFCVKLLRQTKEKYFSDINVKNISDNKKFWKNMTSFVPNKDLSMNNIMLVEDNEIISKEQK